MEQTEFNEIMNSKIEELEKRIVALEQRLHQREISNGRIRRGPLKWSACNPTISNDTYTHNDKDKLYDLGLNVKNAEKKFREVAIERIKKELPGPVLYQFGPWIITVYNDGFQHLEKNTLPRVGE